MVNRDSSEVRATCRENFLSPLSRMHPQNSKQDEAVRDDDDENSDYLNGAHKDEE